MSFSRSSTTSRSSTFLSFGDKMCYFNVESDKDKVSISCCLYKLENTTYKLAVHRNLNRIALVHGFRRECQVSIQTCQQFQVPRSGVDIPFVVLKRRHKVEQNWATELFYVALTSDETDFHLTLFGDTVQVHDWPVEPLFLNGPCVVYAANSSIYSEYLCQNIANKKWKLSLNDRLSQQTQASVPKLVSAISSFPVPSALASQGASCVFLLLMLDVDGTAKFIRASAERNQTNMSVIETVEFKQSLFFTSYLKIATVVHLEAANSGLDEITVFAATRHAQLIRFDNWKQPTANKIVGIPFADASKFKVFVKSRRKHGIVQSQAGAAIVINLETFQVIKSVTGTFDYLLGYFVQVPKIQLLHICIKDQDEPVPNRYFEVTDFKNIIQESKSSSVQTDGAAAAVDNVLRNKMTTVEENVSLAQSRLQDLTKTAEQISSLLRCLSLDQQIEKDSATQLLGLISGTHSELATSEPENADSKSLICSETWEKVVDNNWIIGVDIVNDLDTCVWNLALVISASSKNLTHRGKFFATSKRFPESPILQSNKKMKSEPAKISADSDEAAPNSENLLNPREMATVTAVLDVGIIEHHLSVTVDVVLKFKNLSQDGSSTTTCINIPSCTLHMDDLTCSTEKSESDRAILQELAVMDAVTQPLNVTMVSQKTDLINIFGVLKDMTAFKQHVYTQVLHWPHEQHEDRLRGTWIELLDVESSTETHLCLHTKNNNQTFLLVHYLYSKLPEDVLILPHNDLKPPELLDNLTREATLIQLFTKNASAIAKTFETSLKSYQNFRNELTAAENDTDNAYVCLLNGQIDV